MTTPDPFFAHICSMCGKRVNVETSKVDTDGNAVHEECYASKIREKEQKRNGAVGEAIVPPLWD